MSVSQRNLLARPLRILELYPEEFNVYGDSGNSFALKSRIEMYGLQCEIINLNVGDELPDLADIDIIIGRGGSDSSQISVFGELLKHREALKNAFVEGMPMLVICGMYQLFGEYYLSQSGEKLEGLGIFDLHTEAGGTRQIGNIISESSTFGTIIGYENHAGLTFVHNSEHLLAQDVLLGVGNNTSVPGEGYLQNNAIGSYLHGPLLPKNPQIADWLIRKAVNRRYGVDFDMYAVATKDADNLAVAARNAVLSGTR